MSPNEWQLLRRCGGNVANLARMEFKAALSRLPQLAFLWLLTIPVFFLLWTSFSIMAAWVAYRFSGIPFVGFLTLFLLQALLLLAIVLAIRKKRRGIAMPESRYYTARLMALLFADPKAGNGADREETE